MTPSSTISSVHVSWVCSGYACVKKRAWKTSAIPGTAGRQAETRASMSRTYKTRAWPAGESFRHEFLRHEDRRPAPRRPGVLAAAQRHRVPGERHRPRDAGADGRAVPRRRRHRVPAHVRPAGDGVLGHGRRPDGGPHPRARPRPEVFDLHRRAVPHGQRRRQPGGGPGGEGREAGAGRARGARPQERGGQDPQGCLAAPVTGTPKRLSGSAESGDPRKPGPWPAAGAILRVSAAESGSDWGGSVNSLRRACVVLTAAAGLGLALVPVASADPVQAVDYVAEEGSHPLHGTAHYAGPGDEVRVWVNAGILKVDVQSGF